MAKQVVVVDDSGMVRSQVRRALTEAGYAVIEAVDGQDALERIRATPGVSMVVSDLNMPRMSGLELLEQLRDVPALRGLPVLILTTEGQPELIHRARSLGAVGWIIKPFKGPQLVAAVQRVVAAGAGGGAR